MSRVLTYRPHSAAPGAPATDDTAPTVDDLMRAHFDQRADVIVVNAPVGAPTRTVLQVLARDASASVFVAGGPTEAAALAEAIRGGARGFLCRSRDDRARQDSGAEEPHPPARRAGHRAQDLTRREHDVLTAMSHGRTNAEIAATLGVSQSTVKVYAQHVYLKLRTNDRAQAVAIAFRDGLLI